MATKTTKAPQDHKPKQAAPKVRNVRVLPGEVRIEWDGEEYVLEPDVIDDVDLILALEQDRNMTALTILLGDEQWAKYRAAQRDGTTVRASEASAFMQELLKELQKVAKSGN